MDDAYLLATVRYVELNPVRAKLCQVPEDWRWSSAKSHLLARDDSVVTVRAMLDRIDDWKTYLGTKPSEEQLSVIRRHASTGRPVGDLSFIAKMESISGRSLRKQKPGPKAKLDN